MTETATRVGSFAQAAKVAALWLDRPVSPRTLARIAEKIGGELVELRKREVDDFTHHRCGPEGPDPKHECVAVLVDGGRVQLREEPGGPGVHGQCWRQDNVARLQAMKSKVSDVDPCPELPACFRGPVLHAAADAKADAAEKTPDSLGKKADLPGAEEAADRPADWQPRPTQRTSVATMEPLETFRWMVAAEAKNRHFGAAKRKAFVADGSSGNGTLCERHFKGYTPILDFVHAAEYLHAAAKAVGMPEAGPAWAEALWQGRSAAVVEELAALLRERGVDPRVGLEEGHQLHALQRAWTYLSNASDKLDYPNYRRQGLPTTSSLIESQVKEYNHRLKGSEKFWYESNAEAMLELVTWTLREDGVTLADYFAKRPGCAFRKRETKTVAL